MLILDRKVGEKIMINDDIQVIVVQSKNNSVRLGVSAPKNISVHREEIYNRILAQSASAKNNSES